MDLFFNNIRNTGGTLNTFLLRYYHYLIKKALLIKIYDLY